MKQKPACFSNAHGYTLLQMAIALLVIGILIGSIASVYGQYIRQQKVDKTLASIDIAYSTIESFQKKYGRVPCPAPLTDQRADPTYGSETDCAAAISGGLAAGQCAGGICIEDSVQAAALTGTDRLVVVGALPFRTLQLDEQKTFDGYDGRLLYATTFSATNDASYNTKKGAISIRDTNNASLTSIDGNALYLVLSHGENAIGAYSSLGGLKKPCAGAGQELENCNIGFNTGTASSTKSIYKSTLHNMAAGAGYFDDYISYYSKASDPTWRRTTANNDNIQDLSPNFIGIGTNAPNKELTISSSGSTDSLRVYGGTGTDGKIKTNTICDENGFNCFNPLVIAGDNTAGQGMKCPSGYMVKIANGAAVCTPAIAIQCPATTPVLQGVDGSGNPICVPIPTAPIISCPAQNVTVCPGHPNQRTYLVPAGSTWQHYPPDSIDPTPAGDCRHSGFTCNGTNWNPDGGWGVCTPITNASYNVPCGTVLDPVHPWSWSGNAIATTTDTCSGTTTTYDISACNCKATTSNGTLNCPSPYTGTYPATEKSECFGSPTDSIAPEPSPIPQLFTAPTYVPPVSKLVPTITPLTGNPSSCTCNTTNGWEFQDCPAGFTRQAAPSSPTLLPGDPPFSWPASTSKGQYRKRTVDTATCTATYTAWDNSNCTCDTTPSYSKAQVACANPACEQPKNTPHTIGGVPLAHTEGDTITKTVRDPLASCTPTPTTIYTGICENKPFTWKEVGSTGVPHLGNTASYKSENGTCFCSESGQEKNCFKPSDPLTYTCKCQ